MKFIVLLSIFISSISYSNPITAENEKIVSNIYSGKMYPLERINNFKNIDKLYPVHHIKPSSSPLKLNENYINFDDFNFSSNNKSYDIYDFISDNYVVGLLVLKNNEILLEKYNFGFTESDKWMSMSVAKSISSLILGMAIKDGKIKSENELISNYLPSLKNTSYSDVTIKDLITMRSGIDWDETYTKVSSDRRKMLTIQNKQEPNSILPFMASLKKSAPSGEKWNYNTGDTQVVSELLINALEENLSVYLQNKIWNVKNGMESEATWWLDSPNGNEIGGSGFSATLRDYGRLGLFMLNPNHINSKILPTNWIKKATTPQNINGKIVDYGYLMRTLSLETDNDSYQARGIYNQNIIINPKNNLVFVILSAPSKPKGANNIDTIDFVKAVIDKVK